MQTSWRDAASPQAQADLDSLLNAALPRAHELLKAHGGFFPFGAHIRADGEVIVDADHAADTDQPPGGEVLDHLYTDARANAETLRAVAFIADVRAGSRDAIAIQLEHREHVAIAVLASYRRNPLTKKVRLGSMNATVGTARVWDQPA